MIDPEARQAQHNANLQRDLHRYSDFDLCRTMGWGPDELAAQPADWVAWAKLCLAAERRAEKRLMDDARKGR